MLQRFRRLPVILLLTLYAVFMVATNHRLTILDDEGTIVATANVPTPQRVATFIQGTGQHLHPPLTDILLHEWLKLTHSSFAWLRIPAIFIYVAGLLLTAKCALLLGNRTTYWITLLFGTLWPFGYFYARITGWYCVSFFLIACLTWLYLLLIEQTTSLRWVNFTLVAILLVWSNYYGFAVLLLLSVDLLLNRRSFLQAHGRQLVIMAALVCVCFLPLLHDLLIGTQNSEAITPDTRLGLILKLGYMLFALFASIAVAPWFLPWSLPAMAATLLLCLLLLTQRASRPFFLAFLLLIFGLAAAHTLDLKRLLFLSPWLILAVALSGSTGPLLQKRTAMAALALVFLVGWIGIAEGTHRATSNFYEPWQFVAASTAPQAHGRSAIISDSMPYFFYLNYALGVNESASRGSYAGTDIYQQHGYSVFKAILPPDVSPTAFANITTVRGIGTQPDMDAMNATILQLSHTCRLKASERFTPDPSTNYKHELNPKAPSVPYRVIVDTFDCDAKPGS